MEKPIDFKTYQSKAKETSQNTIIGNNSLMYPILGLIGETGEIAEKIKKIYRDKDGLFSNEDFELLKKEIGDVLWYISELATQFNFSLSEIAEINIEKLQSRKARNVINGDGDLRWKNLMSIISKKSKFVI